MLGKSIFKRTAPIALILIIGSLVGQIGIVQSEPFSDRPARSDQSFDPGSIPEFLIITTTDMKDGFEPLAEWRTRTGLRSEIHLLDGDDGILKGPGRDDAERLFNHISSMWVGSNGELRYVLLGGDSEVVPVRYLHAGASAWEMDDDYLSDVYYSSPSTDWDRDRDGVYGEKEDIVSGDSVDLSFDIMVGRVPASTLQEASRYSERTISYESDPPDGPWSSRFVLSSSLMDRPNVINDPLTEEDEGYDAYKDNGYKAIINHTLQFVPRSLDISEVHDYPRYEGMSYNEENDTMGFNTLPNLLSTGCSLFTFAGQSFYDVEYPVAPPLAYSLAQYIDPQGLAEGGAAFGEALTYLDVQGLDNGGMLPVMYVSSCDSANFSDPFDRDLSNVIIAPEGGAICLIGSTGISWRGEGADYSLGNWYLMSRFWQRFMGSNRPGHALFDLKTHYLESKWGEMATKEPFLVGVYAYNMLGDPAIYSWAGMPQNFGWVGAPETLRAGDDTAMVEVRTATDVPFYDATVSIALPATGEVFRGSTGPDGKVGFGTSFSSSGKGVLCVRARNHLPSFRNITVLPRPPDVEVLNGSLHAGPVPLSEDREAWVQAVLSNNGSSSLTDLRAALFTDALGSDPKKWPEPVATSIIDIPSRGLVDCYFNVTPDRSWKTISVAVYPVEGELDLANNHRTISLTVNARPRFLTIPPLELNEDAPGGAEVSLKDRVFDPDDNFNGLAITIREGVPPWIFMNDLETIKATPPENWSGSLRVGLSVWDGLAGDETELQVNVAPVNDAPVVVGLPRTVDAKSGQVLVIPLDIRDAEGDEVLLSTTSSLRGLTVSKSALRLMPIQDDLGSHLINLTVADIHGATSNYSMVIEITSEAPDLHFNEPSLHLPTARVGQRFTYRIKVGGSMSHNATYLDNTSLFDIEETTGIIAFTPKAGDIGEHWIRISVSSDNVTISRSFMLEVRDGQAGPSGPIIALGAVMVLMLVLLISAIIWKGPKVGQYGLEE